MDFFRSQNQKHTPKHNMKKRLNPDQVKLLERSFTSSNKLEPERKLQLANQLGVPPRQVAIWYQNKRARWKTQSLELDYNVLQQKLENALFEKRLLEKDVERLKGELEKAQEMVIALKQTGGTDQVCCNSVSFEEAATRSSSLKEGVNCSAENSKGEDQEVFPVLEDLYACLIGVDGSSWD
ncbi:hypothetical protein F2P56_005170 [Juglans regia]|uniref:Homeobox-leucine zipper protein n=2 Tax=Juglans regia TaxID=51240 RepID=A0A6P9E8N1_JUGRE|nr:homeobox-leucine zipper protein ATHB-52-like [Juglans regia]KAF5478627.1 hypothetical protein F2P56_005170 [Juglans regia]